MAICISHPFTVIKTSNTNVCYKNKNVFHLPQMSCVIFIPVEFVKSILPYA